MQKKLMCLIALACSTAFMACGNEQRTGVNSNRLSSDISVTQHAILNGTNDTTTEHKAVVGIYQKGGSYSCGGDMLFCTGTLIHPQWVLTAAHCVTSTNEYTGAVSAEPCNKYIKIGVGNTESSVSKNLYDIAGADEIYYHSSYGDRFLDNNYGTIDGDIALIKLKKPISSSVVSPIPPLPEWLKFNSKDMATDMEFAGFGYDENGDFGTKIKFTGSVTKYCGPANASDSTSGCKAGSVTVNGCHPDSQNYGCVSGWQREYILMPYGSIYYDQKTGGPCQGDSGGPAFYKVGDREYVAGVTSYGDSVCRYYGISTAVQDYYSWILSIAPEVAEQYTEICGNGIDDDNNGLSDDDDPECKPVEPVCGDGILNRDEEECDGYVFRNNYKKCSKWDASYSSGNVYCTADCKVSYDACTKAPFCGDGKVNNAEECDGSSFKNNKTTCAAWDSKYVSGLVGCSDDCSVNYDSCVEAAPVVDPDEPVVDPDEPVVDPDEPVVDPDEPVVDPDEPVHQQETCNNGIDDNGDGLIDCADPDCAEICSQVDVCGNGIVDGYEECDGAYFFLDETRCSEWITSYRSGLVTCNPDCTLDFSACSELDVENCSNGIDDNGDGKVDCEDEQCIHADVCSKSSQAALVNTYEICDNARDDDGNGLSDCSDPACINASNCRAGLVYEICDNGLDDNANGLIDCADPSCMSNPVCVVLDHEICGNHIDDDKNGLKDCDDPACSTVPACGGKNEICGNNLDDDGNGKIDCEDSACALHVTCRSEAPVENCSNGVDDDGDGAADCNDADCKSDSHCLANRQSICANGIDDNHDGLIDCQDPICADVAKCANQNDNNSKCQGAPLAPASHSMAGFFLSILGLGALIRRRREN